MSLIMDQLVDGWTNIKINPKYFIGHPKISLSIDDYIVSGIRGTHPEFIPPNPVIFHRDFTPYGLVLRAPRKDKVLNTAVLGFKAYDGVVECLEIHGGHDRYKELTPIKWDMALLGSLIAFAREAGSDAVLVIPHFLVQGGDERNYERLMCRYDQNARAHGFLYSEAQQRFALDIKK